MSLYKANETMELLGHGYPLNAKQREQVENILSAYIDNKEMFVMGSAYCFATDVFNLGVMYGKRAERERRNKK